MLFFGKALKVLFLLLIAVFLLSADVPEIRDAEKEKQISVSYFYMNPCGSCNEEAEFKLRYNEILGDLDDGADVYFMAYNTFHAGEAMTMREYLDEYNVPEDEREIPILFINEVYLSGMDEIEARLKEEFKKALDSDEGSRRPLINTDDTSPDDSAGLYTASVNSSGDSAVIYFYLPSCEDCAEVAKLFDALKSSSESALDGTDAFSSVVIDKHNAAESSEMQLLKAYFRHYGVPEENQKVPVVFVGGKWFSGAESIEANLVATLEEGEGQKNVVLTEDAGVEASDENPLSEYGVLGVMMTGLLNGLNPCSLSIVLFFLSLLAAKNVNLLKAGLLFILGKFTMFFLLGTLLYKLFAAANIDWLMSVTKTVIIILAVAFVVLNVNDMVSAKKEKYGKIRLQLPKGLRKFNNGLVKAVSKIDDNRIFLPLSFLIGGVIAAGEFLCTGQIYLATIVLAIQNTRALENQAVFYFALYGLAFVTPLTLITFLIYKGKEVFDVSESVRKKMPLIKMINAMVFLMFALVEIIWF